MWIAYMHGDQSPDVISVTSREWVAHFEVAQCEFLCTGSAGPEANWYENMSCFVGGLALISIGQKPRVTKHEFQNLNLDTYHSSKYVKFWWAARHTFQCPGTQAPETYPHQNIKRFNSYVLAPCTHLPCSPCNPHPCPLTHPWHFTPFSPSHCCCVFFHQTLTSSSLFPH
jgi:hypothetical protein